MSLFGFTAAAAATADAALDSLFSSTKTEVVAPSRKAAAPASEEKTEKETEISVDDAVSEDDDDEVDADGKKKKAKKTPSKEEIEKNKRSVFVGNLPVAATQKAVSKKLLALFKQHGPVESIRFRSIAFLNNVPRKVSYLAKEFHPDRDTLNAYIVYKTKEAAAKALDLNGHVFEGKHLRVDKAIKSDVNDFKKSVFLGNLAFDIVEESVWQFFKDCENVRIVRDKKTNLGKGFGYVQFADGHDVDIALKMDGQELAGRKVRVTKCSKSQILQRHARKAEKGKGGKPGAAKGNPHVGGKTRQGNSSGKKGGKQSSK
ncbi:Nucleolar protein 12 [Rhizoclosmatium sp. JEL0117]|nr:Nucleolar protein 12 [Rhizoclosmatium sp. JEL0117]